MTSPATTPPGQTTPGQTAPAPIPTTPEQPAGEDAGPEKAAFIKRADALCRDARRDIAAVGKEARTREGIDRIADRLERLAEQVEGARPPAQDREAVEAFAQSVDAAATHLRTIVEEGGSGDQEAARRAAEDLRREATEASQQAAAYGFEVCGRATPNPG